MLSVALSPLKRKQKSQVQIKWRRSFAQLELKSGKALGPVCLRKKGRSLVSQKPDLRARGMPLSRVLGLTISLPGQTLSLPLGASRGLPAASEEEPQHRANFRRRRRWERRGEGERLRPGHLALTSDGEISNTPAILV